MKIMTGCFDFQPRKPFDTHTFTSTTGKLRRIFKSKSDPTLPQSSEAAKQVPKKRFVRILRNDDRRGEEYRNPHVVRKYNKGYWEEQQRLVLENGIEDLQLPYPRQIGAILKRTRTNSESTQSSDLSSTVAKRIVFKEVVRVLEFAPDSSCSDGHFLRTQQLQHEEEKDTRVAHTKNDRHACADGPCCLTSSSLPVDDVASDLESDQSNTSFNELVEFDSSSDSASETAVSHSNADEQVDSAST